MRQRRRNSVYMTCFPFSLYPFFLSFSFLFWWSIVCTMSEKVQNCYSCMFRNIRICSLCSHSQLFIPRHLQETLHSEEFSTSIDICLLLFTILSLDSHSLKFSIDSASYKLFHVTYRCLFLTTGELIAWSTDSLEMVSIADDLRFFMIFSAVGNVASCVLSLITLNSMGFSSRLISCCSNVDVASTATWLAWLPYNYPVSYTHLTLPTIYSV